MPSFAAFSEADLRKIAIFLEASKGPSKGGVVRTPNAARLVQALVDVDAELGICISRAGYEVLATELAVIYQEASKFDVDATLYAKGPAPESSELMHRKQGTP